MKRREVEDTIASFSKSYLPNSEVVVALWEIALQLAIANERREDAIE